MRNASLLLIAICFSARASADGMLDPGFGDGGLVRTPFSTFSNDLVTCLQVLPDGRFVATGKALINGDQQHMAAARYLPSGELDRSFGADGRVIVPFHPEIITYSYVNDTLLQPDGRIVLVGGNVNETATTHFALARLSTDGTLDASFGTGGRVEMWFPGMSATATGAALLPDGRILAVGRSSGAGVAARFNSDGTLDTTFGDGGRLVLSTAVPFVPQRATVLPDGRAVLGGSVSSGPSGDFAVLRLLPSGAADPTFDGDGLAIAAIAGYQFAMGLHALEDGRIVLGGESRGPRNVDFALIRFLPNGALDTGFGTAGLTLLDMGADEAANSLLRLPNGNFMIAGWRDSAATGERDFALGRFLPDGGVDSTFGTSGFLATDFGDSEDGYAVAVAGPDRVLVGGRAFGDKGWDDFAVARYIATTPVELAGFRVE